MAPVAELRLERYLSAATVVVATLFVAVRLGGADLLRDSLPSGADIASHPYEAWYLGHHLLKSGHLSGWSMGWFAGFPLLVLYPSLPPLATAMLSAVVPFAVAYKVVSVLGALSLPVTAWGFARLCRLPAPYPALMACGAVAFLSDTSSVAAGGTITSTIIGEFSFSWGLTLGLLTVGVFVRAADTGRLRWLAAALLGLAGWAHPLVFVWTLALGFMVLVLGGPGFIQRLRTVAPALAAGLALAGVWWVPFLGFQPWMTFQNFEKLTNYGYWLFPYKWFFEWPLVFAALVGAGLGISHGRRVVTGVAAWTALAGLGFVFLPQGLVWNLRMLPFWQLGRWLLVAAALAEAALVLGRSRASVRWGRGGPVALLAPAVLVVVMFAAGLEWGALPGSNVSIDRTTSITKVQWGPFKLTGTWAGWLARAHAAGLESRADWPELRGLIESAREVGRTHGCGRVAWDGWGGQTPGIYTSEFDRFGGDWPLSLLPMWTDECLSTLRGIENDSSASTPFLLVADSLTSTMPELFLPGLPYQSFDLARGVAWLRAAGVKYYLTHGGIAEQSAGQVSDFILRATSGPWKVWEVRDSTIVEAVTTEPVVLNHADNDTLWRKAGTTYTDVQSPTLLAASGPATWQRVDPGEVPEKAVPAVTVSAVTVNNSSVSFHVDRPGTPVLVRVSYFPNWRAKGALGPFRVSPNFMVVVPQSTDVRLSYQRSSVDWLAVALGLVGVIGVLLLIRRRPIAPAEPSAS